MAALKYLNSKLNNNPLALRCRKVVSLALGLMLTGFFVTHSCLACVDGTVIATAQDQKTPVPSKAQRKESLKLIRSLFPSQYADRSDEGKRKLAGMLLKQAQDISDDPVSQYVLFEQASEIAQKVGAAKTAWDATEGIIKEFDVDAFELKYEVLRVLSKTLEDSALYSTLVADCQKLIDQRIELDQYELAITQSRKLLAVAKKGANEPTINLQDRSAKRIKRLASAYSAIKDQISIADSQSNNEAANQAVGEFLCFLKGDFEKGLPYLSNGDSAATKTLANQELNSAETTKEKVALADSWWELGENENGNDEVLAIKTHALEIYLAIVDDTTGLTKARIEKRLGEGNKAELGDNFFETVWNVKWQNGHPEWVKAQFFTDGRFRSFALNQSWDHHWEKDQPHQFRIISSSKKFAFVCRLESGGLACEKYDIASGKLLDRGSGFPISQQSMHSQNTNQRNKK